MAFVARTWQIIQAQIVAQVNSLLMGLNSTSQAAYWKTWTFIQAVSQNLMEQRFTVLQTEIENNVLIAIPETSAWIQAQVLAFQYGNAIQINSNFSISYPAPAQPLIITNCAVSGNGSGGITIKVTTASGVLSTAQVNALNAYLDTILGADINYTIINAAADVLDIFGTVYYNGQYSGSIVTNVTNAVNAYLLALGFNGTIKVSDLIDTIRGVVGVNDFVPLNIYASPNAGTPVYLVSASTIQARDYITSSGLIAIDAGNPLSSSLTFTISQN